LEKNMSGKLNVLVTGRTGKQGGHLVRELLARGHSIRALTRKASVGWRQQPSRRAGSDRCRDFEDQGSLERAARGVDTVFAMSTPFESGAKTETGGHQHRSGSVGPWESRISSIHRGRRRPGHRHSAFRQQVRGREGATPSGVPFTDLAPVFLHENFSPTGWQPASQGVDRAGVAAHASSATIAVADMRSSTRSSSSAVEFPRKRIDIASDELTSATAAATISEASAGVSSTRPFRSTQCVSRTKISRAMFEWFDRVGYDADIVGLRSLYPEGRLAQLQHLGSRAGLVSHHRPGDNCLILRCAARREANVLAMTLKIENRL